MRETAEFIYGSARRKVLSVSWCGIDAAIGAGSCLRAVMPDMLCVRNVDTGSLRKRRNLAGSDSCENSPGKLLAYNCSPSFNWKKKTRRRDHRDFQQELGKNGLQIPVRHAGGLHALNMSMFHLARGYSQAGMTGVLETAAGRVCRAGTRLSCRHASAVRRHPAILTKSPRSFPAATLPPRHWPDRRKPNSFTAPYRLRTSNGHSTEAHA